MERVRKQNDHKRFERLCALALTDSLSIKERRDIELHLQGCETCQARIQDYSQIGEAGMGLVAGSLALTEAAKHWDDQKAREKLESSILDNGPGGASKGKLD